MKKNNEDSELKVMTTIGSIGVGLFILILVWILALIIFVIAVRLQSSLGWFAIGVATLLTIVLIVIPTEKHQDSLDNIPDLEKDYGYIYRSILLTFLIISVIIGFISFLVLHCIEPIRPKLIKSF